MAGDRQLKRGASFVITMTVLMVIMALTAPHAGVVTSRDHNSANLVNQITIPNQSAKEDGTPNRNDYNGRLIVYVVEPTSRWFDLGETMPYRPPKPFGNAVIGYPYNTDVYISEDFSLTVDWDAGAAGYGDITEDNIKVVAALFGSEAHPKTFTVPGSTPISFNAHYLDAAAAATPGNPGSDGAGNGYTHTVFVEEDAATW